MNINKETSVARAATTGGIALLVVALLSAFAYLGVIDRLAPTDLAFAEARLRIAISSLLVVAGLDIVVAWALFRVFEPAGGGLARMAACFRVAYAAVFVVAIAQLVGVLRHFPGAAGEELFAQVLNGVHAYEDIWNAGLVLFAFHLVVLGVLIIRSTYAPTFLGILVVIAGLGYAVDSFGTTLVVGYGLDLATYTFVGEVFLIFWLLVRGRRLAPTWEAAPL